MPKARPLPADPEQAARIIRRREQIKRAVINWRKRHPAQACLMFRHCIAIQRHRERTRRLRAHLQD